ncbi:uncharacterized protein LOC127801070 isoform X2 [Diospyros lotus]|uniref:uncharacterized protein LOC127801070 isoform X2 n=1 Tax=Diospyros lotus TaxID=55363 RepID=UPI002251199D|nr:uncharacterized protein LOC127801070 isoform X2 [Diospyros lotus]
MALVAAAASYGHAAAAANNLIVVPLSKPRILGAFPSLSHLDLLHKIPTPPHHNFYDFPLQFGRLNHHHHHHHNYSASYRTKPAFTISSSSSSSSSATTTDVTEAGDDGGSSSLTTDISSRWVEFAKNVSGEWDGYEAEFSKEGKPMELPESVVPEAYREWEVKLFDWQTQCPTLARPRPDPDEYLVLYKSMRLLPTVGCEADAATRHSVDERTIGLGLGGLEDNSSGYYYCAAFAYQSTGCYVAVWVKEELEKDRLLLMELEHCLIDPRNRESRVRIVQRARLDGRSTDKKKLVLQNVKVCCEQWYGPFRNGEQLGGCAIRDSAFASTDALKASQLTGVWQGLHAVASFHNSPTQNIIHQELVDDSVRKTVRDENNIIINKNVVLLPKQLWCWVEEREDGETWCEVGWLLDHGRAITSKCIFSPDGTQLKEIAMAQETAMVKEQGQ